MEPGDAEVPSEDGLEVAWTDGTVRLDRASPRLMTLVGTTDAAPETTSSLVTVIIAFGVNLLVALAKSVAAFLTGSASMTAEAAHSWADTGNEIFLLMAERRSQRAPDDTHPYGFGRDAYVWSLFAALGLFVAGAAVSVTHGVTELLSPEPATDFVIGYVVLGMSFVLESVSFLQSVRQARSEAAELDRAVLQHVLVTSDPTLRAVFAEDSAALIGLVLAGGGLLAHQLTGSATPDAIGSILVGLLLGVVAWVLITRNRRFLIGQEADPRVRAAAVATLLDLPEIDRVTFLRLEVVGPKMLVLTADVDLIGDDVEHRTAVRLRGLEARIRQLPMIVGSTLSLSSPDEPSLVF